MTYGYISFRSGRRYCAVALALRACAPLCTVCPASKPGSAGGVALNTHAIDGGSVGERHSLHRALGRPDPFWECVRDMTPSIRCWETRRKSPNKRNPPQERVDKIFDQLDKNHDNRLTLEEFREGSKQDPKIVQALSLYAP
ncbi:hypothetical protein MRX96_028217 [Rhipicephalus microplus]